MRTVVEQPRVSQSVDDAEDRWPRTRDAWDTVLWVLARGPEGAGSPLSESGATLRSFTLDGARSIGLPTVTVLYRYSIVRSRSPRRALCRCQIHRCWTCLTSRSVPPPPPTNDPVGGWNPFRRCPCGTGFNPATPPRINARGRVSRPAQRPHPENAPTGSAAATAGHRVGNRVPNPPKRPKPAELPLATFRRKIGGFMNFTNGATQSEARRNGRRGLQAARSRAQTYGTDCFAMARPMLMRLSAITPRPTQRFMPASPL